MQVKITQTGKTISQIILAEDMNLKKFKSDLFRLGKRCHLFMLEYITKNTKSFKDVPQPDAQPLIETIDYEERVMPDGFGWGIGDKDVLNQVSKYWHIWDVGGKYPSDGGGSPTPHPQAGKLVPGYFSSSNVFVYAPYSGHFIRVGHNAVIQPMNYTQETRNFLDREIIIILRKYHRG